MNSSPGSPVSGRAAAAGSPRASKPWLTSYGVVYNHDGHGGAADDVDLALLFLAARQGDDVAVEVAVDHGRDTPLGNADQDDGLRMFEQPRPAQAALGIQPQQDVDRLARVADAADEIGIDEDIAQQPFAVVGRGDPRVGAGRFDPPGARIQFGWRHPGQETIQLGRLQRRQRDQQQHGAGVAGPCRQRVESGRSRQSARVLWF